MFMILSSSIAGVSKPLPVGQLQPIASFPKSHFIGTQPHSLIYILPVPAFALQWQSSVAATETLEPA